MKRSTALYGVALGATLMYLFDPDRGRYRRAIARDKTVSGVNRLDDALELALRDFRNRAVGLVAELRAWLRTDSVPDDVLIDRIRSHIGRVVSHPKAIEVTVHNGHATLAGRVLAHEHQDLCRCVRSVYGVNHVEDKLAVHETAEHIPELQGGVPRRQVWPDILQENWAPSTRMIVGATGSSLAINALRHKNPLNTFWGLAGATLLLRALANKPLKRMSGITTEHPAGEFPKPRDIAHPVTTERQESLH